MFSVINCFVKAIQEERSLYIELGLSYIKICVVPTDLIVNEGHQCAKNCQKAEENEEKRMKAIMWKEQKETFSA